MGASPDTRSPPPDGPARHATHSCIIWRVLENTGALEQRHVDATERVGGGWVGGVAGGRRAGRARGWRSRSGSVGGSELDGSGEVEDGAAEGAETLPYFTVNSTAVPAYDAFCSAPVSCGKCLPGSLTAGLETVSAGPGTA